MTSYTLIGLMSGTSMDGVDLAHCSFTKNAGKWRFSLLHSQTYSYTAELLEKLNRSRSMSGIELTLLDKELAEYFALCIKEFAKSWEIDLHQLNSIASHGHTVFHQPEKGITLQIGCGTTLCSLLGIPVINDFRKKDVLAGGQGAPLVPIGDRLLFGERASAFLNIGGFVNVCLLEPQIRAFDICPGNLPLNALAQQVGKTFDEDGKLAEMGAVDEGLLYKLNALPYYDQKGPKSLGTEWLDREFSPLLTSTIPIENRMRTCVEHIAQQIVRTVPHTESLMITGGGAKNNFLIDRIKTLHRGSVQIPELEIIDFKEAIIFAFLGALFLNGEPNCLSAVTGAEKDVRGGVLHLP